MRFQSPPSLQVAVDLPNGGKVAGMGIRPGVTLVVGGGFHGKSTLLKALEAGVTNKAFIFLPILLLPHPLYQAGCSDALAWSHCMCEWRPGRAGVQDLSKEAGSW